MRHDWENSEFLNVHPLNSHYLILCMEAKRLPHSTNCTKWTDTLTHAKSSLPFWRLIAIAIVPKVVIVWNVKWVNKYKTVIVHSFYLLTKRLSFDKVVVLPCMHPSACPLCLEVMCQSISSTSAYSAAVPEPNFSLILALFMLLWLNIFVLGD